ncbi:serine/threonine protein phosphatase family protein [Pseudooceanicola batsensis HTCC2597]|uniref:Serine/threonine protein phosphatase family protein n=1 Tax=Pseudooceanicola batsensis (strain ATCC BAA-863 / DSM 15984 / KCTC 12145 / HTCC2597) TaxID=252305 RepID=A3U267_PSEBH|nr:metallophosphoesterase family protein [Pseudooceanicola batsensis]EAQ01667.1 serine/threonine protein phosphatase family protein [Pseudooceanicola batsensis HTCC2597]
MTIYAVGDIHGQRTRLEEVLARIDRDGGDGAEVIFLGDYVDRGPDSRGVVALLSGGIAEGRNWTCLRGNHDRMYERFLADGEIEDANIKSGLPWLHSRLGGMETLRSYGISAPDGAPPHELWQAARVAVPAAHRAFLSDLQPFAERPGLLFVHAGIRPGVALKDQSEDDLYWIRGEFLTDSRRHPWLVVHGHTALEAPKHYGNRVNLDGGAGYGRALSVAGFDDDGCFLLTGRGRERLAP